MTQETVVKTDKAQGIRDILWGIVGARDLLVDYPAEAESAHMEIVVERAAESIEELMEE